MASNLIEALEEWIDGQPAITGLFPAEVYLEDAPPGGGAQLPSLTFSQETGRILNIIGGGSVEWPEVNIEVQAAYAEDARRLASRVREIVLEGEPLSWTGGRELGRYKTDGEGGRLKKGIGPDGSDVWEHFIPLVFLIAED